MGRMAAITEFYIEFISKTEPILHIYQKRSSVLFHPHIVHVKNIDFYNFFIYY